MPQKSLHLRKKYKLSDYAVTKVDKDLSQKSIGLLLLQYSLPAIIATVATSLYNLVDRIFIGQFVGPLAISGLGITLPIMSIATAFGTLVGSGAASIISIRLGESRKNDAFATLANAVILNLIIGVLFSMICLVNLDKILYVFGASDLTIPYARSFMVIILLGNPVTQMFFSLNTIQRASGYPAKAMLTVLLTMFVNLVLVYVFVYRLQWGIEGAAWATVLGQCSGLFCVIVHFCKKHSHIHFLWSCFSLRWNIIRHIISIGLSPFLIHICSCIVVVVINWQLKKYAGDYAIGAYSVINTVVNFVTVIVLGLSQGMQPIVGYNYGARMFERVSRTLWLTIIIGFSITTAGFVVMMLFPMQIAHCFTTDASLANLISNGMRLYILAFPLIGFQVVVSNFFQSIGKPNISIFLSLSRQVLFLIPCVLIFPLFGGLNGIWVSMSSADFLSAIVTAILLAYYYKKIKKGR